MDAVEAAPARIVPLQTRTDVPVRVDPTTRTAVATGPGCVELASGPCLVGQPAVVLRMADSYCTVSRTGTARAASQQLWGGSFGSSSQHRSQYEYIHIQCGDAYSSVPVHTVVYEYRLATT
eukprot:COSAG01_NODE_26866_length_701_cov_0.677741_1_plen_120_part_10